MNSDKMREEFEAWYEGHCAPLESDWFKRDSDFPDEYDYFPAQEAWSGWQASRAALCVELPSFENGSLRGYNGDCNEADMVIDCIADSLDEEGVSHK